LKDGTTYLGEYSKTEGKIVYFKPHDAFVLQLVNINKIKTLELSDGRVLSGREIYINSDAYQKLTTEEKALYDAKTKGIFEKISIPKSLTSQYSKMLYEEVYFNKISQRKTRLILGSVAVTVGVAFLIFLTIDFSMDFGGSGGNWGMGGYSGP